MSISVLNKVLCVKAPNSSYLQWFNSTGLLLLLFFQLHIVRFQIQVTTIYSDHWRTVACWALKIKIFLGELIFFEWKLRRNTDKEACRFLWTICNNLQSMYDYQQMANLTVLKPFVSTKKQTNSWNRYFTYVKLIYLRFFYRFQCDCTCGERVCCQRVNYGGELCLGYRWGRMVRSTYSQIIFQLQLIRFRINA